MPAAEPSAAVKQAAARALLASGSDVWSAIPGFRANAAPDRRVEVEISGQALLVEVDDSALRARDTVVTGERLLFLDGEAWSFGIPRADHAGGGGAITDGAILAPMPGKVIAVEVTKGATVVRGRSC